MLNEIKIVFLALGQVETAEIQDTVTALHCCKVDRAKASQLGQHFAPVHRIVRTQVDRYVGIKYLQ